MGKENKKKDMTIKLEGELTVQRANELKKILLEKLNKHKRIIIDHQSADEFDLTYLQLLLASQKYSQEKKKNLIFEDNTSLVELMQVSGVSIENLNMLGRNK